MHRDRLTLENFRLAYQNGELVGGLGYYSMGQWFGGKCLPMAGVAAVGIAPEHRGTGVAFNLMAHMLQEFYAQDIPISALYPATQPLYRRVGYEQGGTYCHWSTSIASIEHEDRDRSPQNRLPMFSTLPQQQPIFDRLYHQHASQSNGHLERTPGIWQAVFKHDEAVYAYIVGTEAEPQGYLIFSQCEADQSSYLEIWDWVALSPLAIDRLWRFIASHRSQMQDVRWHSGAIDSRLLPLSEQGATIRDYQLWFLRIVNVRTALAGRGYPTGIEAELHLAVTDDLLPDNQARFILTVSDGNGSVTVGGRGDMQLDVRALAPLYTGLLTARQLQGVGQLTAPEQAIATATDLFAGAHPFTPDFF